jgi:16S rRNA (cytosine1402-N4)-methyltransferase
MITRKGEHTPVLLAEAIDGLAIKPNGIYIDGTFGRGGHAKSILTKLSNQGRLIAIDKDPNAITAAQAAFAQDKRLTIQHGSFADITKITKRLNIFSKVNGILLDLGVSSPQLDDATRGFSFLRDGPLDMRMNPNQGVSAATWLAQVKEQELTEVLKTYGEERFAKRIAKAIIKSRANAPITTTKQLTEIVAAANPKWEQHKHPATRSFQAIRIFINHELEDLQTCLQQSLEVLAKHGRLVVISFHSLEDRIVKHFIQKQVKGDEFPSGVAVKYTALKPRLKHIGRPIKPDQKELANNPRARSAILRIAEKLI